MNINFEVALQSINLGSYDKAADHLKKAIEEERANGNESIAIEYTCVLGDLFSNLGDEAKAKVLFDKVIEYCDKTNSLGKQREIAEKFLKSFALKNRPNSTQTSEFKQ